MLEVLVALGLLLVAVAFPVLMIRGVMQMWRDRDRTGTFTSGVAGALSELDRVVRPSVEHTLKAKEAPKKQENDIDGD